MKGQLHLFRSHRPIIWDPKIQPPQIFPVLFWKSKGLSHVLHRTPPLYTDKMWFQAWQEVGEESRAFLSVHGVRVQMLFISAHRDCVAVNNLSAGILPHSGERGCWVLGTNNPMSCAGIKATQLTKKNTSKSLDVLSETVKRGIKWNQKNVCHGSWGCVSQSAGCLCPLQILSEDAFSWLWIKKLQWGNSLRFRTPQAFRGWSHFPSPLPKCTYSLSQSFLWKIFSFWIYHLSKVGKKKKAKEKSRRHFRGETGQLAVDLWSAEKHLRSCHLS